MKKENKQFGLKIFEKINTKSLKCISISRTKMEVHPSKY